MTDNEIPVRVYATFILRGKELDPQEVTERLSITPSRSFIRGDRRNEKRQWPHGFWALTSDGNVDSTDLSLHLDWLVKQLGPSTSRIQELVHDNELKAGAREFHHMMLNTSPDSMSFCFDVHWVYRGTQNSEVAVFDVLKLYGKRVVELHLRQSVNGIWSETFGEGDIDYKRLVDEMKKLGIRPHLVIEQCIEEKSPNTVTAEEAHKRDLVAIQEMFKPLL